MLVKDQRALQEFTKMTIAMKPGGLEGSWRVLVTLLLFWGVQSSNAMEGERKKGCGLFDFVVTSGTDGYAHRIEHLGVVFQWKPGKDEFEMVLTTTDATADWVGVGFCRDRKRCMDDCDYVIAKRPTDGSQKLVIEDCFLPKETKDDIYNLGPTCGEKNDVVPISASHTVGKALTVTFKKKIDTGEPTADIKLEGPLEIVLGRGKFKAGTDKIQHQGDCGRSKAKVFNVESASASRNRCAATVNSILALSILVICLKTIVC